MRWESKDCLYPGRSHLNPCGELGRKKNDVSREEVSEYETRDRATVCELGVHFQGEETENLGS